MSDDLFDFSPKQKHFAVFGKPIAHSKSPQIHQLFAQQFGLSIDYQATLVEPGGFIQSVQHFKASGGIGLNITVPYKVEAWKLADSLSKGAQLAKAVNTLHLTKDGQILGENTDGIGMVRDLEQNLGFSIKGRSVLLIGAGGAVRGVLGPLLARSPSRVLIVNRTEGKALELSEQFSAKANCLLIGGGLRAVADQAFDLVINGTAASLSGQLPDLPESVFSEKSLAYDMMYSLQPTIFMQWARNAGAQQTADGLGMLVEQAAESFKIWHGVAPDTQPVITTLRQGV